MGRLRSFQAAVLAVPMFLFLFLPACGGHKPAGTSPFPAKILLNPSVSASMQLGSVMVFTASATNGSNTAISPTFTFSLANGAASGILDISPNGLACAGTWNAPFYSVCTPGASGEVGVVASALGSTSAPTLVFVHPPIDEITVSLLPPVNPPPTACPGQTALPAACDIPFNGAAANYCVSQNQVQTLQAKAFSQGTDITALVGPFTFAQVNLNVVKITPIVSSTSSNVPTNQITIAADTPGATQITATASGVSSQPYVAETCPVQCIALQLGTNGTQEIGTTSFVTTKGTAETITATAVDVQGCIVPTPSLTWTSSAPAAITAGTTSASAACGTGTTCSVSTPQPGAAVVSAACTPPTCNVGFPTIVAGLPNPSPYVPQPVYPVTAISGLVTGATSTASILATSQDCYSNSNCAVAVYNISSSTNLANAPSEMPAPPNSLLFDSAGDRAYAGSQYGAFVITTSNLGSSSTSPFTTLPAAGTPSGLVTGKVIGVSPNGNFAVFSDTVSIPNQVYVVDSTATASTSTPLNINSATTAAFSPDSSKVFILGNGGNTLYVYSPLQALQTIPLTAPADAIAFSSSGAFAFIAGGSAAANVTVLNTCNNAPASAAPPATGTFSITGLPATPLFLKMFPPGSAPTGNGIIPALPTAGLDVFVGIDNAGIDVFATAATESLILPTTSSLCPQQVIANASTAFPPTYINLNRGTFHPISFFLSPDGDSVYIVTSDQGVLIYNFRTGSVDAIPLIGKGNPAPIAADITVDGTLLYVAGTDGELHELNTQLELDENQIAFSQLPNSSNDFCYSNITCGLNIVAVKP